MTISNGQHPAAAQGAADEPVSLATAPVASVEANPQRLTDETTIAAAPVTKTADGMAADAMHGDTAVAPSPHRRKSRRASDTGDAPRGGRFVAWAGFVFGSVFSIVMNWLHTWLPADHMPPGWAPGVAPQVGSAVWPVCLLLSVEVLSRVRWRPGLAWLLARYAGVGTVAAGSAVISYGHVHDVLDSWGYGQVGAGVGPLVLDGLMVACGFALLSESGEHHPATTTVNDAPPQHRESMPTLAVDTSCDSGGPGFDSAPLPQRSSRQDTTAIDNGSDADRDNRIREMYRRVSSTREVGKAFGLHHSTVARIVAEGATAPDSSDAGRSLHVVTATANKETTA
ncbi:helix-turn-helix domain-containing protein [Nocardia wallacei]|uniref:DUF2637 domain-containing protein n=1 Tax=Nocardia wallacei TaxID=480035 RepID=A0A7G1KT52_9NOCA|nr:hypothetical protein [Nocardia wallacei]BCK57393.1 hypothetical protein NWFMUON74_51650 [Nocardia wallacei]